MAESEGRGFWAGIEDEFSASTDRKMSFRRSRKPVRAYRDEAGNMVTVFAPGYATGAEPGPTAKGKQ